MKRTSLHAPLRAASLLLLALGAGTRVRAEVLIVDAAGSTPFLDVQSAVDAAVDGDVILVLPGTYAEFDVTSKALALSAQGPVDITGTILVSDVGAGQYVVLDGFTATGQSAGSGFGLLVRNNAGSVWVQDGVFTGSDADPSVCYDDGHDGIRVAHSASVALVACSSSGGGASTHDSITIPLSIEMGGAGLFARSSTVSAFECQFSGGGQSSSFQACAFYQDGAWGGPGVGLEDVSFFAAGCLLVGADGGGGRGSGTCSFGGPGGDGISCTASTAVLRSSTLLAGLGGSGGGPGFGCIQGGPDGSNGLLIDADSASSVIEDPSDAPSVALSSPLTGAMLAPMQVSGPAGWSAFAYLSGAPANEPSSFLNGQLMVALPTLRRSFVGTLDDSGMLTTSYPIPSYPDGGVLFLQILTNDPPLGPLLGSPRALVIVP